MKMHERKPGSRALRAVAAVGLLALLAAPMASGAQQQQRQQQINQLEEELRRLQEQLREMRTQQPTAAVVTPPTTEGSLPLTFTEELDWRSIGAVNMGGRITDLSVYEAEPSIFYVASASGGLLKTTNNGTTFEHQFDRESVVSLGDVEVSQSDPNLVWVGTGEENPRNSVSYGNGVYKSTDGGATWVHKGLPRSFQVGSIVIHPEDNDVVFVGALGRLYGPNPERGLYKTTDGGENWEQVLFVDDNTGVIDIAVHPNDPNTMIVAAYERMRTNGFDVGEPDHRWGPGSGIYKTTDGGATFRKLTEGLPTGELGRSGLSYSRSNPDILVVLTESSTDGETGLYKSEDGGESFTLVNTSRTVNQRPMYFSKIRIDPNDPSVMYSTGVRMSASFDGGVTWATYGDNDLHPDHHALWINPRNSDHILLGCDGGFYMTYDRMRNWEQFNNFAIGQYYHVGVDNRQFYRAYGGLQDNGSWGIPAQSRAANGPRKEDAVFLTGGDGFLCFVDPNDPDVVFASSQNGNISWRNLRTGERGSARGPGQVDGERNNFNWETPYRLSHHNSRIFYSAGSFVMKSLNRGANIQAISPRVTRTNRGSSTDLSESPLDPDVLWVGTDEGNVWVTRDGGANWTEVTENIGVPGPYWVASVEASRYEDGRAFVAFDAHRSNDDAPFLYMTDDFGETWTNITNNLPVFGSTRVLREDIQNENLLYVGTEFAAFASIDRGASWTKINNNDLPTVAVHDFAQHPTRGEIVAGTHGRSLWVLDVTALRQFTAESIAADAKLYRPNTAIQWDSVPGQYYPYGHGVQRFYGENPPGGSQIYYSLASPAEAVSLKIIGPTGETIRELGGRTAPGLHRVNWNHQGSPDTGGGGRGGAAAFAGRGGRGGQGAAQVQTEQQQGGGEQQTQQGGRRGRRGAAGGGQQQQVRGGAQGGGEQTQQGGRRGRRGAAGGGVQGGGQQQQVQGGAQGGGEQTQQGGRRGRGGEQAQQRGGRGGRGGGGRGGRGGGGRGGGGRGYGPGIYRVVLTVDGAEFTETLTIEADKRDG